jgi:hypothetical protein
LRTPEFAGVLVAAVGFAFAWVCGREDPVLAHAGVVVMLGGFLLYVVARIWQRAGVSRWIRSQLLAATIMSVVGVLNVMGGAAQATEGPRPSTLAYWLTTNQTYHADSRVVLRKAWVTFVGIVWFALVLGVHRVGHHREVARPNRAG